MRFSSLPFFRPRVAAEATPPATSDAPSTLQIYKRLIRYFRPYWMRTILALVITIPIGALDGVIAFSLRPYVDAMQAKQAGQSMAHVPLVIVGFTLLQGVLNYVSIYLNGWLGGKIMTDLRRELFLKLQTLEVSYFDNTTAGSIIQGYFQDPQAINTNILNNLKQSLTRLFSSLFLMGVLIMTSWQLSIVAISILLCILYPSTRIRKIIKSMTNLGTKTTGAMLSYYTETAGGIRVIYGYNLQEHRQQAFEAQQKVLFGTMMKMTQAQGWLTPSMHFIASIGVALIIWQGSTLVLSNQLTTGGFVSFITALLMLYNPIKNLGGSIFNVQMSLIAANRIFKLLDRQPTVKDRPGAVELQGIEQSIELENVTFGYTSKKPPVLKKVSLTLHRGETVALVGGSGGGKTTIAALIPRFYDVKKGTIRIDGRDIRDFTLASLRARVALVTQDNFLFSGTLRENLLMGRPDATEAQMWDALEQAYLGDFVRGLPDGLEALIGERGVMLSGGQRQRVAIARAILKDAPIVILDEATSALDNESEAIVQQAMDALMAHRTVLVIAHRLSTIRNADRIVVLEAGQIVESGTPEELKAAGGRYAALLQASQAGLTTVAPVTVSAASP